MTAEQERDKETSDFMEMVEAKQLQYENEFFLRALDENGFKRNLYCDLANTNAYDKKHDGKTYRIEYGKDSDEYRVRGGWVTEFLNAQWHSIFDVMILDGMLVVNS